MHEFSSEDGLRAESAQLTGIFSKFGWGVAWGGRWRGKWGTLEGEERRIKTLWRTTPTTRGVLNLSPYGFPKGEGSVSAPPLIVDNHRFLPLHLDGPAKQESCGSSNAPQRALLYIKEE